VLIDGDDDPRGIEPKLACRRIENALVRLMGHDPIDFVRAVAGSVRTSLSTSARFTTAWRKTSFPFMRSLPTVPVVDTPPST
jgi:hypothetical protein